MLNIGGIANVTLLPPGAKLADVRAFDTGPGNCISDHLMRLHDPRGPGFDADGALAENGTPIAEVLDAAKKHPFFQARGPKSTDGPEMIQLYLDARRKLGRRKLRLEDELATAAALCAWAVARAIRFGPRGRFAGQLIVSGGGIHNRAIMAELRRQIDKSATIHTSEQLGVVSAAKEALAFALLGAATLDRQPGNVPTATGARRGVVLGSITPRP